MFSAIAVSVTAIVAALTAVCKPVRNFMKWLRTKMFGHEDKNQDIINKIDALEENLSKKIADVSAKNDESTARLESRISSVEKKNDDNQKSHLKRVIFQYGNYCRKKQHLSSEEFRYLQDCFNEYTELGGNGTAHDEFVFITDCYNKQLWNEN